MFAAERGPSRVEIPRWTIEPELDQPVPRRVVADVPSFQSGIWWLRFGVIAVVIMTTIVVGGSMLLKMKWDYSDPRAELANSQKRYQDLLKLKQNGVKVEGRASTEVKRVWDKQYDPFAVQRVTSYTYPGGHGKLTPTITVPSSGTRHGAQIQMDAVLAAERNLVGERAVTILYLPEEPAIHVWQDDLDKDLAEAPERIKALTEKANKSIPLWLLFVGLNWLGVLAVLVGLVQVLLATPAQFFLTVEARQRRDLARYGVAVPAPIVEKTTEPCQHPLIQASDSVFPPLLIRGQQRPQADWHLHRLHAVRR